MPPDSRKILLKKRGKIITKEGGLGQYPPRNKKQNRQKQNRKTTSSL
jgi:hypothetical protein